MNRPNPGSDADDALDPKIRKDWAEVEARRSEINSRDGGDTRRQAILRRLRPFKFAAP